MKPVQDYEWATQDGATIKGYTFGNPDADPTCRVVVECGAFLPALVYAPFASALAKQLGQSWGIYVYDRRGKGQSSPVDENDSLETELQDVVTALRNTKARHRIVESLALGLEDRPRGELDLGAAVLA